MEEQDLQDLYGLLRGNADAITIMDARGLFVNRDYVAVLEKVISSRERYETSKSRTLKMKISEDAKGKSKEEQQKDKRLVRKQDKYREILNKFDEIIADLTPIVERAKERAARESERRINEFPSADGDTIDVAVATEQTSDDEDAPMTHEQFLSDFISAGSAERLDLVNRCFDVNSVTASQDLREGELYFIDGGVTSVLAFVEQIDSEDQLILASAIDTKPIKPVSIEKLVKLGRVRKTLRLGIKDWGNVDAKQSPHDQVPPKLEEFDDDDDLITASSVQESNSIQESPETAKILDKGAFSQLADAAQRTGICAGVDAINHVRDREFRMGNFQDALQTMENVYGKFSAAAQTRSARLRQEDANIQSGRTKMSPKELQAKRLKDNQQNQLIERARNRFSRVLDGLRVLIRISSDET